MSFHQRWLLVWICLSTGGLMGLTVCKYSLCLTQKVQKRLGLHRMASVIWLQSRASSNLQLWCYTQISQVSGLSGRKITEEGKSWVGRKWKGVGKGFLREKGLIWIIHPDLGPSLRQELKAGYEAETAEECSLLACSSWLTQPAFLYKPGPPAQGWQCPKWTGLSQINREESNP